MSSFAVSIIYIVVATAYPFMILLASNTKRLFFNQKLDSWFMDLHKETFLGRNFAFMRAVRRPLFLGSLVWLEQYKYA